MLRRLLAGSSFVCLAILLAAPLSAQPLQKAAISLDPGNTKQTGATFTYRLTYNCSSTSGPCLNAEVVDLLPIELAFISTVPASPTGDVNAINVTPNFMGSGRTRVQFVMITPLPAGNSGDLLINVRFPNGSTPDGTVATNTADGINLGASPGTFTTPAVNVTAVATVQTNLQKTLTTSPANLDMPETYRLRISVPNSNGALNLTSIGPVVDTLHAGTVFNGATPAADCEPGCIATTPASVTWTSPCSTPLTPGGNCDIFVNVTFPSGTFPSGTNITNNFTVDATPLGKPSQNLGIGTVTHPVTTFVPAPGAGFSKNMAGGTPNPPTLNQTFSYDMNVSNNGNVPLDTMVITDTLPIEMQVASVTTGSYSGFSDFGAGVGVRVSYEKNTALGVFTLWGSSPAAGTNTTLTAPPPGLGAGEYLTRIRWEYGQAAVGASASTRPIVTGQIINPDHAGGPVAFGDSIQNCSDLTAVYTAGPTNVNRNDCETFVLSGPFVQLNPAKDNLSGGGPFNPGQTVNWRLRVRSAPQSSDPVPLENLVSTDLLPVDLNFSSWTFDDQGTGLPAPQFTQIPNFAGTGRTLLRWTWNAGSGNLAVNQQVWINIATTIRNGALSGSLSNDFTLDSDAPGLSQRCSGSSQADTLDYDGDANTAETLCRATGTINVAPIAQLISSKTIQGTCDGGSVSTSSGTLIGGGIHYTLKVQNVGTVPMENFVLIDILPFIGDTGVRDTNPRGSQWSPLLAAPIIPPSGTTLYYSTSGNPCRGEVGGPTTSCDPPNWTTVAPNPITSVRSFKLEFGNRVVNPFDFVSFQFVMTTPGNIGPGLTAYNSFAYQTDRSDGLGSLAAEPQKVGIALGSCDAARLGNFVWVDTNNDGIQNDGPTGLNGVFVRLFSPGVDGVAGTFDDVPLASTITGPGPDNAPGWYSFPGLAPGTYFVQITPPPSYAISPRDTTTEANDSDSFPNGMAAPVTLGSNEDNPNIDFGLFPTAFGAAGNYVWFDRNNDGIQNEPTTEGVNGVTVRLYLDDGDGNPEPGGDDPLAQTMVTTNDVYSRPGYYLFDGLAPGLPYFIQFVTPASATGLTTQNAGGDDTVDSDADPSDGTTPTFSVAALELNPTFDAGLVAPSGTLSLGDQVWLDTDNDGVFEPQNGEVGIDDVRLDLYIDNNADGKPTLDEFTGSTTTATSIGFAGKYLFDNLAPGNYIVVVAPQNFGGGGALSGKSTSTGNDPAPDPDDDANGDDNGTDVGALIASRPVTLSDNGEPTSEDGDNDSNLTVDFGFINTVTPPPVYDYGDAPDVGAGTSTANYNTTALDNGPYHLLDVPGAPFLGPCVDDDNGFLQNVNATDDDTTPGATVTGTCVGGDDENGVAFSGSVTPGGTASFSVTAGGAACSLDAWVDWNQNGVFGDSGEQIATSLNVPLGPPTLLTPSVPAGAIPGTTYARFRCSTGGGLPPTGAAPNGEVEDYKVTVIGHDFTDAPASYGSADHIIDPLAPLLLGACVDTETVAQPNAGANGDDAAPGTSRIGSCFDDEDGVLFEGGFATCTATGVDVTATGAGLLNGWVDFNADGDFNDPGEQVFTNQPLIAGTNALSIFVPCNATAATTYSRFRLSTAGGLTPTGTASNGEVEDYVLTISGTDFGDDPNSYLTTFGSNGARHTIVTGYSLGATVDAETDGQPNAAASGDGADEDGVTMPAVLVACSTVNIPVTLTNTAGLNGARLDGWIDFAGDGVFDDPADRVATSFALTSGANNLNVNVPCGALSRASYARFRLTSTGVLSPFGPASDGEVEDYPVTIEGLDFGDAPDPTFPTLLGSNGARHAVLPVNNPTLGATVDTEANGAPSVGAIGDDTTGSDDEDGVTFPTIFVAGMPATVHVTAGPTGGNVNVWIDFTGDGDWNDANEHVVTDQNLGGGASADFGLTVPVGSFAGDVHVRARISSQSGLGVTGLANDGEIEDYVLPLVAEDPEIGTSMRIVTVTPNGPCGVYDVVFEVGLENTGNVTLSNVQATTVLNTVFVPPAVYSVTSITSTTLPVDVTYNGASNTHLLLPGATLLPGESGIIRFVVHLDATCTKVEYVFTTTGSGTSPGTNTVTDQSQDGDDTDPDADGNPTDNNDPTVLALDPSQIPTLDEWALIAVALMLAAIAVKQIKS
jgi:large repetitive protein